MRDGFGEVPIVVLLAVVAVPACRVVATLDTHPPAASTGQKVHLLAEAAASRVLVAVARCNGNINIGTIYMELLFTSRQSKHNIY